MSAWHSFRLLLIRLLAGRLQVAINLRLSGITLNQRSKVYMHSCHIEHDSIRWENVK